MPPKTKTYTKRPGPKKHHGQRRQQPPRQVRMSPGSDPKLKDVFSRIGTPEETTFSPDPFQLEAIKTIEKSDCIVTAPTGSGKTWIAEQVIKQMLERSAKTWYASPLKALSNSIYEKFSHKFGDANTGILTGDRKENSEAPIIIGTTEILRNQLYDAMHSGEDLNTDFVILDEAHFLGDHHRGVVWEETMIYLPRRIPLLLLSATIGNPEEIADWLYSIREKECRVVHRTGRPVSLYPLFLHPSGTLFPLLTEAVGDRQRKIYKKVRAFMQAKHPPRLAPPHRLPPMNDILRILRRYNLLPAIFFMKSRADCDRALELCDDAGLRNDPERKSRIAAKIDALTRKNAYLAGHKQLRFIAERAVGAHHSGHLPAWKKTVESFMNDGYLEAVFATSTVAAGVNFPARSVVILNSDRFNGKDFMPLSSIEFHQMTGRAGRRGKDNIGFALMLPGKFMDLKHIAQRVDSRPSEIDSQIKINFSMTLNLLLGLSPDRIQRLLKNSFAHFQHQIQQHGRASRPDAPNQNEGLWNDFLHHLNFLQHTGFADEDGRLTSDGIWASQLRVDHPLMIAESFRLALFPDTNPALLAAIIAAFVNERQVEDTPVIVRSSPKKLRSAFYHIRNRLMPFTKHMTRQGFTPSTLYLAPATMYQWASGHPFGKVAEEAGLEEGDLANLIFRTADNLRHIATLSAFFPEAAQSARKAAELIIKEPLI